MMKCLKLCFIFALTLLVIQTECGRSGGRSSGGSRSSGSRSSGSRPSHSSRPSHTPSHSPSYSHTPSHSPSYSHIPSHSPSYSHIPSHSPPSYPSNRPGIGFENVHHQTNSHPVAPPAYSPHNVHHQTNANSLGTQHPSAPGAPPAYKPGIGFENIHHQTNAHGVNSHVPSAPVGPPINNRPGPVTAGKPHDIGFENVQNRLPSHPPPLNAPGSQAKPYPVQPPLNAPGSHAKPYPVQPPSAHPHYPSPPVVQRPYQPQTVVHNNGHVYYQPPVQPQYRPPITTHHTTIVHQVPVYTPVYSSPVYHSSGFGNTGSFLGGYLIGRMSSHSHDHYHHHHTYDSGSGNSGYGLRERENFDNNVYYREERPQSSPIIYTVHHYYQNPEHVPQKFEIKGENVVECNTKTSDKFCAPNTNGLCLKNGTVMCTTPLSFTSPCNSTVNNSTVRTTCVYTRIDCEGRPPCNVAANQTYIDYYVPCLTNVTLAYRVDYSNGAWQDQPRNYDLCVTAMAVKQTITSPIADLFKFVAQLGAYHTKQLMDFSKTTNSSTPPPILTSS